MSNVLSFPTKAEPLDDVTMCSLSINGRGDIELIVNAECIDTAEQHKWRIAKMAEATARLVDRKRGSAC